MGETDKLCDRIYGRKSSAWLGRRLTGERGGSPIAERPIRRARVGSPPKTGVARLVGHMYVV
jgi:hypothetical protein